MRKRISLLTGVLLFVSSRFDGTLIGQDVSTEPLSTNKLLLPDLALDRLQADHSDSGPLLVSQDELNQLIQQDGGLSSQGLSYSFCLPGKSDFDLYR